MPQLPITPAISPLPSAGASQSVKPTAPGAEGGEGTEGSTGLSFSAVLAQQLKEAASLTDTSVEVGLLVAAQEGSESASTVDLTSADTSALPVDLSALTASLLVPAPATAPVVPTVAVFSKVDVPIKASSNEVIVQSTKNSDAHVSADLAANGKNLPQVQSQDNRFDAKLAALVETPIRKTVGEGQSMDASAIVNAATAQAVQRNEGPLPAAPVAPRVGSAEWGGAVGEKVVWMVNQSHQVAELHLNPPNLGPLEVRLVISNDQATASFVSHHAAVREAIETAVPRLREMLADNGIMLGNVMVGSESFNQQQASEQWKGAPGGQNANANMSGDEAVLPPVFMQARAVGSGREGMVDIFA